MPTLRFSKPHLQASQTSLQDALRRAQRNEPGRASLRVSPGSQPEAQRLVFMLLSSAATVKGGSLLEVTPDDWLLTELPSAEAERLHSLLTKLLGEAAVHLLPLPASKPILAGLLTAARLPQFLDVPAAEPISPLGLETRVDNLPLAAVYRRLSIIGITDPSLPRLIFQRLALDATSLHQALGSYAEDRALLSHARSLLHKHILEALGDEGTRKSVLGGGPIAPLLLDLPPELLPTVSAHADEMAEAAAGAPALYATLALHEAIACGDLATRRAALSREAWGIAISGISATALTLVDAEALPADLLVLEWSAGLDDSAPLRALRRLDPARLILDGCDGETALSWGLSQGIQLFGGPWIEDVIAAGRMDRCPASARCTRAECRARGLATSPTGRLGCLMPHLLEAVLPEAPA
jgi:hypothetical protein